MKKIEINDEIIEKIAAAEFKKNTGKEWNTNLPSQLISLYIRIDWKKGAREMLENYNRVVEILDESNVGTDCRAEQH